jgi:hypothetical protein
VRPGACWPPLSWPSTAAHQGSLKVIQCFTLWEGAGRLVFAVWLLARPGRGCVSRPQTCSAQHTFTQNTQTLLHAHNFNAHHTLPHTPTHSRTRSPAAAHLCLSQKGPKHTLQHTHTHTHTPRPRLSPMAPKRTFAHPHPSPHTRKHSNPRPRACLRTPRSTALHTRTRTPSMPVPLLPKAPRHTCRRTPRSTALRTSRSGRPPWG